jgi:signal peptidase I
VKSSSSRRVDGPAKPASRRSTLIDYLVIAGIAIVLALVLQAFVVKPFRIPSPSMVPTLEPRDRVLVNRFIFHFHQPQGGDIIVFRYPRDPKLVFIKRVIGTPGDVVSLDDGKVVVNGQVLDEPYLATQGGQPVPTVPLLPAGAADQPWSLNEPYTVPADSYFVMGDNRLESEDSRFWGPVPKGNLIGDAFLVYWPPQRIKTL